MDELKPRQAGAFLFSLKLFLLILGLGYFGGCKPPALPKDLEMSYYYWQPRLDLSEKDKIFFVAHQVCRLYVRYFDLDWNPKAKSLYCRAEIHPANLTGLPQTVVPVVFITPEALKNLRNPGKTARLIRGECRRLSRTLGRTAFSEIQLDGDWTPQTREAYFNLLKQLKLELQKSDPAVLLSVTIRLHQIKYRSQTGVPPADRGSLMVYHTSAVQDFSPKNSLLDEKDALSYLGGLKSYPLPLDVALPRFQWGVQFNPAHRILRIIRAKLAGETVGKNFRHLSGFLYQAKADVYLDGIRFMKDDYLKLEDSDPKAARRLESWILQQHPNPPQRVIWFEYSDVKDDL